MIRLLFLLHVFMLSGFAVIDIATVDFGDKSKGFSGSLYGSFQKQHGNTEKDEAEYGGRIQYDTNKTISWLQGKIEHDEARGSTTDDNAFAHLRHIHQLFNPRWAAEFYTQVKKDKFQNIRNRTVLGIGGRYKFIDAIDYGKLFIGLSAMDERVAYTDDNSDPQEHNYRVSSYLSYNVSMDKNLDFSCLGYYQPKFGKRSDYTATLSAELMIHLTRVLDLSYVLDVDYDTNPARNVLKTDTKQRFSFVYRFGQDDPLSIYAQKLIASTEKPEDIKMFAAEKEEAPKRMRDSLSATFPGEWQSDKEELSIFAEGKGSYWTEDGVYREKFKWERVLTEADSKSPAVQEQNTNVIIIRFEDEEGRKGRIEKYLYNGDILVSLSGSHLRIFKRKL